jgi:hypothetical protein
MENDNSESFAQNANSTNPNNPSTDAAPVDPSNTSNVGQKVETGVASIKEGLSEQSSEWEDIQERGVPGKGLIDEEAERYIKDPSPEEVNHEDAQDEADKSINEGE